MVEVTGQNVQQEKPDVKRTAFLLLCILFAFVLFFFALDLLKSSFEQLGSETIGSIIKATANPFTGFFIGLIVTAIIQSSSTTTAFVVALVGTNSLTLENGIPIIMGANVGTTITSLIVSLTFISKKKEFRRAVSAASFHCFFNLLTLLLLFPLEYYYQFLSKLSLAIAQAISTSDSQSTDVSSSSLLDPLTNWIITTIPNLLVVVVISFAMLFISILIFRRIISGVLKAQSPEAFSRFFFSGRGMALAWGFLTTAAIRSSTITTSVAVPIVAKKVITLRQAAPFIIGANVGTTVTAFIALIFNVSTITALSVAIAHFLFNLIGSFLFFPIPALNELPVRLSSGLGKISSKSRIAIFAFVVGVFFVVPAILIFLSIA